MTREYAVEMIKAIKNGLHETGKDFPYRDEIIPIAKEALEVAIIELQQEPCDDAISRQAAIDAIFAEPLYKLGMKKRYAEEAVPAIFEKIKALPPVTPQYTEAEIQKMQDLEFAEIQKAYELGKADGSIGADVLDKIRAEIEQMVSRYTISRERGGMGQVEWEDRLIKEADILQILDKYKASPTGEEVEE